MVRRPGGSSWDASEHPRDYRGRFITVGMRVRIAGGTGRVTEILPGRNGDTVGAVYVQLDDGRGSYMPADRLEIADPPRGGVWLSDGTSARPGERVRGTSSQDLPVTMTAVNDDGSITVSNSNGTEVSTMDPGKLVRADGTQQPPEPPRITSVTISDGSTARVGDRVTHRNGADHIIERINPDGTVNTMPPTGDNTRRISNADPVTLGPRRAAPVRRGPSPAEIRARQQGRARSRIRTVEEPDDAADEADDPDAGGGPGEGQPDDVGGRGAPPGDAAPVNPRIAEIRAELDSYQAEAKANEEIVGAVNLRAARGVVLTQYEMARSLRASRRNKEMTEQAAPMRDELWSLVSTDTPAMNDPDENRWDNLPYPWAIKVGTLEDDKWQKIRDTYVVNDPLTLKHNASLRTAEPERAAKAWGSRIDKMVKQYKLEEDATLYRASAFTPEFLATLVPGSVLEDRGFQSTDKKRDGAAFYGKVRAESSPGRMVAVFELQVHKDQIAADVGYDEFVLPRNSKMVIKSVTNNGDGTVSIKAEVAPNGDLSKVRAYNERDTMPERDAAPAESPATPPAPTPEVDVPAAQPVNVKPPVAQPVNVTPVTPDAAPVPAMSREDADRFAEGSVITDPVFHGTTAANVEAIQRDGFALGEPRVGNPLGNGVYFTRNERTARGYADTIGSGGGDVVEARLQVSKMATQADVMALDYSKLNGRDTGTFITEELSAQGFDGVDYDQLGEIVIFNPNGRAAAITPNAPAASTPAPTPDVVPEAAAPGAVGSDGVPLAEGQSIVAGNRTGTITAVRVGAGRGGSSFVVYDSPETGRSHTAAATRVRQGEQPVAAPEPEAPTLEPATNDDFPDITDSFPIDETPDAPIIGGEPTPEPEAAPSVMTGTELVALTRNAPRDEYLDSLGEADLRQTRRDLMAVRLSLNPNRFGDRASVTRADRAIGAVDARLRAIESKQRADEAAGRTPPEFTDRNLLEMMTGEVYDTNELADAFQVSNQRMLARLNRMETLGFVNRNAGEDDGDSISGGRRRVVALGWEVADGRDSGTTTLDRYQAWAEDIDRPAPVSTTDAPVPGEAPVDTGTPDAPTVEAPVPAGPLAADGMPLVPGDKVMVNGRAGTITSVREGTGIAMYQVEGESTRRGARFNRFLHVEEVTTSKDPTPTGDELVPSADVRESWTALSGSLTNTIVPVLLRVQNDNIERLNGIRSAERELTPEEEQQLTNARWLRERLKEQRPLAPGETRTPIRVDPPERPDSSTPVPVPTEPNLRYVDYSMTDLEWEARSVRRRLAETQQRIARGEAGMMDESRLTQLPLEIRTLDAEIAYRNSPAGQVPFELPAHSYASSDYAQWGERAEAISSSTGPNMDDLYAVMTRGSGVDRTAMRQQIQDMYNGENGLGTKGHLVNLQELTMVGNARISYSGSVTDKNGSYLGTITRTIILDEETKKPREVHNDYLRIDEAGQGTGMARELYRRQEDWFIRDGVPIITIHANIDVGGFAWARAGFLWQDRGGAQQMANGMISKLRYAGMRAENDLGKENIDAAVTELEAMVERLSGQPSSSWPTPFQLSQLGYTEGATTWPGKWAMLGQSWMAIKYLDKPNDVRAAAPKYTVGTNINIEHPETGRRFRGALVIETDPQDRFVVIRNPTNGQPVRIDLPQTQAEPDPNRRPQEGNRVSVTRNGATITGEVTLVDPSTGRIMMRRDVGGVTQFDPNEDGTTIRVIDEAVPDLTPSGRVRNPDPTGPTPADQYTVGERTLVTDPATGWEYPGATILEVDPDGQYVIIRRNDSTRRLRVDLNVSLGEGDEVDTYDGPGA